MAIPLRAALSVPIIVAFGYHALGASSKLEEGTALASSFLNDRIYVDMPAPTGAPLHLFTDSGGGSWILSKDAALRLGLSLQRAEQQTLSELGPDAQVGKATAFVIRQWIGATHDSFTVIPKVFLVEGWPAVGDGVLGNQWFGGHSWTWDYPNKRLYLRPPKWRPPADARAIPISFKTDANGRRAFNFARMTLRVDGEDLPMLFDTGATTLLSPNALKIMADDKPALRGTSMVSHSVVERWHSRHADWPILEDAQVVTHSRMILVPEVELSGRKAGPVWFTERSDQNFHEFMSSLMSDRVEGSIGGNILNGFIVSVDYPRAKAWIQ